MSILFCLSFSLSLHVDQERLKLLVKVGASRFESLSNVVWDVALFELCIVVGDAVLGAYCDDSFLGK